MLKIEASGQFRKDYKLAMKRGFRKEKLEEVIRMLANEETLPPKYRDHALTESRNYHRGVRECHIEPDWLLVYEITADRVILYLQRTGTHSDLFK